MKRFIKYFYRRSELVRDVYFISKFLIMNKYFPNFKNPRTFNEKINFRKRNYLNKLFAQCSDKIAAKEYVAGILGTDVIIQNIYIGESIEPEVLKDIVDSNGSVFVKANHNSGPVYKVTPSTSEREIRDVCTDLSAQLETDFGYLQKEGWYSEIEPKILVEKELISNDGEPIKDYKFHIFQQKNGSNEIILQVDFDRTTKHNRTFFNRNFEYLDFGLKYPVLRKSMVPPQNIAQMFCMAEELAKPFSYVRVDFYNLGGKIFFGELTFAHGSGLEHFSDRGVDLALGELWEGDPSY